MLPRLISFLDSQSTYPGDRKYQAATLFYCLTQTEGFLRQAHDLAKEGADISMIAKPLWKASVSLTTRKHIKYVDPDPDISADTLAGQMVSKQTARMHRPFIYEIALISIKDLGADVLRLLRDMGADNLPSDVIAGRITTLLGVATQPVSCAILPEANQKPQK